MWICKFRCKILSSDHKHLPEIVFNITVARNLLIKIARALHLQDGREFPLLLLNGNDDGTAYNSNNTKESCKIFATILYILSLTTETCALFFFTISLLIVEEVLGVVLCDHFSMPVVNTLDNILLSTGSHPLTYHPDLHVFVVF